MNFLKTCLLSFLLIALFLCGCSQSNEDELRKVKRFEALKGLPLDTVLTRAYKFYRQFQTTGDTLLRDSMNDYRDHFFARWELSSDSLCGTVAPDDSLAMELREIYKVVMEFDAKDTYWHTLDKEKRESLMKKDSVLSIELVDPNGNLKNRSEHSDLLNAVIMDIPLKEAVSGLKKAYSIYDSIYFVRKISVLYFDTSASDMNEMEKINVFHAHWGGRKEAKFACMDKTPMGHKVLILNKEYESLLNIFMKANFPKNCREEYVFWLPKISVYSNFWDYVIFESSPIIYNAVFNKSYDLVKLDVGNGDRGRYYYLSKKNGKWKLVKIEDGWFS
jgi:hypothetical protein